MSALRVGLMTGALGLAIYAASWPVNSAVAAEATLMIKVRLIRCVTQKERKAMCSAESMCCEFIDGFDDKNNDEDEILVSRLTPGVDSIWISPKDLSGQARAQPSEAVR